MKERKEGEGENRRDMEGGKKRRHKNRGIEEGKRKDKKERKDGRKEE